MSFIRPAIGPALLAIFLGISGPVVAQADDVSDAEKLLQEIRERAVERGDVKALADFALKDFSAAQGYVDACQRGNSESEIREMSDKLGAWMEPGLWAWATGSQSSAADRAFTFANLRYSTERYAALREGCSPMMLKVKSLAAETYREVFNEYLRREANS